MNNLKGRERLNYIKGLMNKLTPINESVKNSVIELTKRGSNGKIYAIVRENHKYYIKVAERKSDTLLAEDFNYLGGLKNKTEESFPTYAKALKRLNIKLMSIAEACNDNNKPNTFVDDNVEISEENCLETNEDAIKSDDVNECGEEVTEDCEIKLDENEERLNINMGSIYSSVYKAINESNDDNPYSSVFVLPSGIDEVFDSIDDIKKKS